VQQRETWLRRRLHRVKVITGGGRRRRWTAEAVDRMEIVSGPAVVRIGTEWCRGAATGAEGAARLGVMRYRGGLGSWAGLVTAVPVLRSRDEE
jgi:hypothetical protein